MKIKDINSIIPVNYDALMYIKWLSTDAMNTSQTARELFNGYYDTTNPSYSNLVGVVCGKVQGTTLRFSF